MESVDVSTSRIDAGEAEDGFLIARMLLLRRHRR
jgi:hypothetical protein